MVNIKNNLNNNAFYKGGYRGKFSGRHPDLCQKLTKESEIIE